MSSCPHGMPNPKTCYDCMEEGNLEPPKWKRGDLLSAQFPSTCKCGDAINPGELIVRWDKEDAQTTYTHIDCKP